MCGGGELVEGCPGGGGGGEGECGCREEEGCPCVCTCVHECFCARPRVCTLKCTEKK